MLARTLAAAVVLALSIGLTPAGATSSAAVSENDYQRLVTLHSPAISPDGKSAVLVVSHVLWDEDRLQNDLVLIDLSTHSSHRLVADRKGLSDPVFSPDGTKIAFLADAGNGDDAKTQLFVLPLPAFDSADGDSGRGDRSAQVTNAESDVEGFAWRPDGEALAYVAADSPASRRGPDRFRNSFIFTTEPITARTAAFPRHLFLATLDGHSAAQLTFGTQSVASDATLSWSPDGKTIAFTQCPNAILNDESFSRATLLDVESKRVRALTSRTMWEGDPLFPPTAAGLRIPIAMAIRK